VFITSGAVDSVAGKTGVVTLVSGDVGLGNVENKSSATIRGELTSGNVTTALGFTPYNATNPSGYTTNTGTVTSIATNNGITGGTITTTGTIGLTGQALALHNLATNGVIARTGSGTVAARTITAGTAIRITNGDGVSGNPTITNTGVTSITATTPIVASASTGTVALSHANSGVTAGTYNNVTVNATGHVTAGSNVAYLTSYTETDTLATVTGRGATTATAISLTNTGTSLTTSGNIGIKTSTPTVELEVNGSAYISGSGSIGSANGIYAGDLTDQQIFLRPGASGMPPSPMGLASLIEGSHNAYGYLQALRASTGDGINPHFLLGVSPEGVTLEEYGSVYGSLMFVTSTNERMRITATGELGLGVIPNTWDTSNNFSKVLELPRAALFTTDYFDTRVNLISNAYLSASSGFLYSTDGAATMYSMTADGSHVWYNMGSGLLGGSTIPDPMMVLTSSGNLGIGTGIISASEKLEVIGNIKADVFYARTDTSKYVDPAATSVLNKLTVSGSEPLTISSPFPSTNYILHSNTSGTNVIAFLGDGSLVTNATTDLDYAIRGGFGGRIVIATQNDGVLWVTPSTNVGIGNENPTYKLDVIGDARVTDKVTAGAMEVNSGIIESSATISANYTIAVGNNAMSTGPIAINSGVTVTVPSGSTWTII
jgi:hypothetical protein